MKTIRIIMISCALVLAAAARAQQRNHTLRATVGTGIALDVPATTPVLTQFIAAKQLSKHWALGVGTGFSLYEKPLIPIFAHANYRMARWGNVSFTAEANVGGTILHAGGYVAPAVGVNYRRYHLSVGYEYQSLKRIKQNETPHFVSAYREELSHHTATLRLGVNL